MLQVNYYSCHDQRKFVVDKRFAEFVDGIEQIVIPFKLHGIPELVNVKKHPHQASGKILTVRNVIFAERFRLTGSQSKKLVKSNQKRLFCRSGVHCFPGCNKGKSGKSIIP